ncbi:hypothetical protein PLANPX_4114 [Lacipirellula parvula]|uniref:Uncharacterized protein n=1 Tax=Lacipirellula parvula TaxID=2650471 RepID=A0A5K7XES3_9BACT|nr:hypothetical protein PLANPX_4114 [Lacipirellula parvula]
MGFLAACAASLQLSRHFLTRGNNRATQTLLVIPPNIIGETPTQSE